MEERARGEEARWAEVEERREGVLPGEQMHEGGMKGHEEGRGRRKLHNPEAIPDSTPVPDSSHIREPGKAVQMGASTWVPHGQAAGTCAGTARAPGGLGTGAEVAWAVRGAVPQGELEEALVAALPAARLLVLVQ